MIFWPYLDDSWKTLGWQTDRWYFNAIWMKDARMIPRRKFWVDFTLTSPDVLLPHLLFQLPPPHEEKHDHPPWLPPRRHHHIPHQWDSNALLPNYSKLNGLSTGNHPHHHIPCWPPAPLVGAVVEQRPLLDDVHQRGSPHQPLPHPPLSPHQCKRIVWKEKPIHYIFFGPFSVLTRERHTYCFLTYLLSFVQSWPMLLTLSRRASRTWTTWPCTRTPGWPLGPQLPSSASPATSTFTPWTEVTLHICSNFFWL